MNLNSPVSSIVENYRSAKTIKNFWSEDYDLHALVPAKEVIKLNKSKSLDAVEKCYLNGINFNYTLYKKEDVYPLMSIDFKGIGYRFGEDAGYIELRPDNRFKDKERPYKLKLKAAKEFQYPYFIISICREDEIDKKAHIKIIEGIIENFISKNDFEKKANELFRKDIKLIGKFKPFEIKKYIIDFIIIPLEKNIGQKHNRFKDIVSIYERKIIKKGAIIRSFELNVPKVSDFICKKPGQALFGPGGKCKKKAETGSLCELDDGHKKIVQTVLIRNTIFPDSLKLAENIAKYLIFKKYLDQLLPSKCPP